MDKALENFQDPSWWISVLLLGIIASAITRYLGKGFDKLVGNLSNKYKVNTAHKNKILEKRIEFTSRYPAFITYEAVKVLRELLFTLTMITISIAIPSTVTPTFLGVFFRLCLVCTIIYFLQKTINQACIANESYVLFRKRAEAEQGEIANPEDEQKNNRG